MKRLWERASGSAPADAEAARDPEGTGQDPRPTPDEAHTDARRAADLETGDAIAGERGIPSINRVRSLQSRVSSLLAIGLMLVLGLGLLGWYYRQLLAQPSQARESAVSAVRQRAQGDMPLPPLGAIGAPVPADDSMIERVLGPAPELADESAWADWQGRSSAQPSTAKTPREQALERRLSGPVFSPSGSAARSSSEASGADGTHIYASAGAPAAPLGAMPPGVGLGMTASAGGQASAGELASRLRPTPTPAALAQVLPSQRLLLPKGAFIDCTLETAIDSTLAGMTTCVLATDTFSVDGKVVLLERGTKLVGETSGNVQHGSKRVFVVWTQARTPTGVVVPLDSPGTDELGRAGLPGRVNRHFWERFGAAILISVIDGAVQAAVQSSRDGDSVVVNPSGTQSIMTEVLKGTINIPPTVVKQHGDRIQVLVARDLDFRSVYELRAAGG